MSCHTTFTSAHIQTQNLPNSDPVPQFPSNSSCILSSPDLVPQFHHNSPCILLIPDPIFPIIVQIPHTSCYCLSQSCAHNSCKHCLAVPLPAPLFSPTLSCVFALV